MKKKAFFVSSRFCEYLEDAPVMETGDDYIVKQINARKAVMALPDPKALSRDDRQIPDIPVTVVLSTTKQVPTRIRSLFGRSELKEYFLENASHLEGLCINGRGMPVKVFIHQAYLEEKYRHSEKQVEDVFWEEYIHGGEDIELRGDGYWRPREPWSFRIQAGLLRMDEETGFEIKHYLARTPLEIQRNTYIRCGLDVQEHASETFAAVGTLMLEHVRRGEMLPRTRKDAYPFFFSYWRQKPRSNPMDRLFLAHALHGKDAQDTMIYCLPEMLHRTARMYGCASLLQPEPV